MSTTRTSKGPVTIPKHIRVAHGRADAPAARRRVIRVDTHS
jgi:hypothetical protein